MEAKWKIDDFTITISEGKTKREDKNNKSKIVIAQYRIRNNRKIARKFSNERYSYIVNGDIINKNPKLDSEYSDSLINQEIGPNAELEGYIRIPYKGDGMYGVQLKAIDKFQEKIQVVWQIQKQSPLQKQQTLQVIANNTQNKEINSVSSYLTAKNIKTKPLLHPKRIDLEDEFIYRQETRSEVFGSGRKKSLEWNNNTALKRYAKKRRRKKHKKSANTK